MAQTQAGIIDWGVYIPRHRLSPSVLAGRKPPEEGPERALAWADEDCITLSVEAARKCLSDGKRAQIDLLIFASTTHAFEEKQGAALIAAALGLSKDTQTVDVAHSLRAGAEALALAHDAVASRSAAQVLIVIADCRMGAPGSELERSGGDAGVAFIVGTTNIAAHLCARAVESEEIVDVWRRAGDRFTHSWEDRFASRYGFQEPIAKVAGKLPPATGKANRHWAVSATNSRSLTMAAKLLKATPEQIVAGRHDAVGFCGAAHAPLLLASALDGAAKGDEIALLAHGDGATALLFSVEESRSAGRVAEAIADRVAVTSLATYRRARALDITEYPVIDDQGISATIHYRERAENLRLQGQRCQCGEPQFPKQRICIRCGAKDQFTDEDFAEQRGSLVTFTHDSFFPAPDPPTALGIVQVENGPRIYMQLSDLDGCEPQIGMPVRFVFRKIHNAGKRPNYFWKAVPDRSGT